MSPLVRIACLRVPALPLTAVLRVDPTLRERAVAIVDGRSPRSLVVGLSDEAEAAGLALGMTAAQARAVCEELVLRPRSEDAVRAATAALADVAGTIGPRVEVTPDGTVFLDCTGSSALCASERELASILGARAGRQGLAAEVGIASSKSAARVAARSGGGICVVPPGATRAFLAPLPIAVLDPEPSVAAALASWGLRRIGDLAALPAGALGHRLGPAAVRLVRVARDEDDEPLDCRPAPTVFHEALRIDYGIEQLEPLLFLARPLVERLLARLALHGLACQELALTLELDGGGRHLQRLPLAAPTGEGKTVLTVLRSHLERQELAQPVTGIVLASVPARMRPTQLDFFQPNGPSPTTLAATIARLAALCGADRVGMPRRVDSHRPDAVAMAPREGDDPSPSRPVVRGARVALRAFRPPVPLDVFESRGRLDYVRGQGFGGRVVRQAGPWRLHGEWWTSDPLGREYYDVELSDGGLYRMYHETHAGRWLADGTYD